LEQAGDQALQPCGAIGGEADVLPGTIVEPIDVGMLDQLQVAPDHAQRLLHVVRRDLGELLQLAVRLLQRLFGALAVIDIDLAPDQAQRSPASS
jgi:hypothetical protein